MTLYIALPTVVFVWSTTPLAVKWSAVETDPYTGIFFRILIATAAGLALIALRRTPIIWHKQAITYYMINNLCFVSGLTLVYIASTKVNSGLISIIFGFSPIISSLFAHSILNEPALIKRQWVGFLIALSGLTLIFRDQIHLLHGTGYALLLLILSVHCFSLSGVLLKRMDFDAPASSKAVGSLITSLPLFALIWLALGDTTASVSHILTTGSTKGWLAISYLGIFGSVIGMVAYLYTLQHLPPGKVALATLVTPVIALYLSSIAENSAITSSLLSGAALVLAGIAIFIFNPRSVGQRV